MVALRRAMIMAYRVDDDIEGQASEALWSTLLRKSPYSHPTIGWEKDIRGYTLDDFGIERALDDVVPAPWRYYIRVDTDGLARDLATEYTVCEDGDGVYLFEP